MQQMMLTVRPKSDFEVPSSTGYQLYSALLAVMRSANPGASGRVHDSEIGAIAVSGLSGTFGKAAKRPVNKMLHSRQTYRFHIGITDPDEIEIFQSLIQPLLSVATHQKTQQGLKLRRLVLRASCLRCRNESENQSGIETASLSGTTKHYVASQQIKP